MWSVILYVLAGVLIVGAAVSEIWLSLDKAGPWLFGVYGAAAAIAILALLAFCLAYTAELPAKAPKAKKEKKKRGKTAEVDDADESDDDSSDEPAVAEEISETAAIEETTGRGRAAGRGDRPKPNQKPTLPAACVTSVRPERRTTGSVGAIAAPSRSTSRSRSSSPKRWFGRRLRTLC